MNQQLLALFPTDNRFGWLPQDNMLGCFLNAYEFSSLQALPALQHTSIAQDLRNLHFSAHNAGLARDGCLFDRFKLNNYSKSTSRLKSASSKAA